MKTRYIIAGAVILFIAVLGATCNHTSDGSETAGFKLNKFESKVRKQLTGHTMGFGFVIYKDGQLKKTYSHGLKRTAADGGNEPFDDNGKMFIASMSKTLTAISTLQLLKKDNLTTYTKIEDYLPSNWHKGPNINKITFRELMRHEAGIRDNGNQNCNGETYDELECKIDHGVKNDSIGVYQYQNMDYALLRVIIPKLEGYKDLPLHNDTSTAHKYIRYVKHNIFKKCGITGNCFPEQNDPFYTYNWPYNDEHGQKLYDYTETCGAYGWYLSVSDYGKIINKLFDTHELLDAAWLDTLKANGLGNFSYSGAKGSYLWHNGIWSWTDNAGSGKVNTCWMYFPNDVEITVEVNSDIPEWFPKLLADAYDASW